MTKKRDLKKKYLSIIHDLIRGGDAFDRAVPDDDYMKMFLSDLYQGKKFSARRVLSEKKLKEILTFSDASLRFFDCQSMEECHRKYQLMYFGVITLSDIKRISDGDYHDHPLLNMDALKRMRGESGHRTLLAQELLCMNEARHLANVVYYDILRNQLDDFIKKLNKNHLSLFEKILNDIEVSYKYYNSNKLAKYDFYVKELKQVIEDARGHVSFEKCLKKIPLWLNPLTLSFKKDASLIYADFIDAQQKMTVGKVLLEFILSNNHAKISEAFKILSRYPEEWLEELKEQFEHFFHYKKILPEDYLDYIKKLLMAGRYLDAVKWESILKNTLKMQGPHLVYGYYTPIVKNDVVLGLGPLVKVIAGHGRWPARIQKITDWPVHAKAMIAHSSAKYILKNTVKRYQSCVQHTWLSYPVDLNEVTLKNIFYRYSCHQLSAKHNPDVSLLLTPHGSYLESRYTSADVISVRRGNEATIISPAKIIATYIGAHVDHYDHHSFAHAMVTRWLMHFDPIAYNHMGYTHEARSKKISFVNMHDDAMDHSVNDTFLTVAQKFTPGDDEPFQTQPFTFGVCDVLAYPLDFYTQPEFFDEALLIIAKAREKSTELFEGWLYGMQALILYPGKFNQFNNRLSIAKAVTDPKASSVDECQIFFKKALAKRCDALEHFALELQWWHLFSIEDALVRQQSTDEFLKKHPGFRLDYYSIGQNSYALLSTTLTTLLNTLPDHQRQRKIQAMLEAKVDAFRATLNKSDNFVLPMSHLNVPPINIQTIQACCDEYFSAKKNQSFAFFRRHSALFKALRQWLKNFSKTKDHELAETDRAKVLSIICQHHKKTTKGSISYEPCLKIVNSLYGVSQRGRDDTIYRDLLTIPVAEVQATVRQHFAQQTRLAHQVLARTVAARCLPQPAAWLSHAITSPPDIVLEAVDHTKALSSVGDPLYASKALAKVSACLPVPELQKSLSIEGITMVNEATEISKAKPLFIETSALVVQATQISPVSAPLTTNRIMLRPMPSPQSAPACLLTNTQPSFGRGVATVLWNSCSVLINRWLASPGQ